MIDALAFALSLAVAPAPMPSVACAAPAADPAAWSAKARRRRSEVWSDSLWLVKRLRVRHADRLAGIYIDAPDGDAARIRLVVRVTGHAPLPPMRLGGRAKGVPVVVQYGARASLRDVEQIRADARLRARVGDLLPDLQGEGYDEARGVIHLVTYAPDLAARRRAFAQCSALRTAYGLPVRIEAVAARVTEQAD